MSFPTRRSSSMGSHLEGLAIGGAGLRLHSVVPLMILQKMHAAEDIVVLGKRVFLGRW